MSDSLNPTPPVPPDDNFFSPGDLVADRYEVLALVGTGSYGVVYRAQDTTLGRIVGLKVLRTGVLSPETAAEDRERFVREGRTAAKLSHPNIVTVYDAGEWESHPYIVMELVSGETLEDLLARETKLTLGRVLGIASQMASTLAYAHDQGIVHRDVKPGNVILGSQDSLKLADFGLAKEAVEDVNGEAGGPVTERGTILGTVAYISPERIRGEKLDGLSDVYSLGIMIYEMLSGAPPFVSDSLVEVLRRHVSETPRPICEASGREDIPEELEHLLVRMLDKERKERPEALKVTRMIEPLIQALDDEASRTLVMAPTGEQAIYAEAAAPDEALPPVTLASHEEKQEADIPDDEVSHRTELIDDIPSDPYIGKILRDCEILSVIGEGGMGAVYKARHTQLGAFRAVKIIRKELASQEGFYDRFRNEAILAESLSHPNLVKLYDFSRLDDGSLYTLWEFVEGSTLQEQLKKRGVFTPTETVQVMRQVLSGLSSAHKKGIVHRDIALDNIMLVRERGGVERVKLIDFGIAKDIETTRPVTQATEVGVFVGKIGYSSPEQLGDLGPSAMVDYRADIFSVGIVLFKLLTGHLPFKAAAVTSYMHDIATLERDSLRSRFPDSVPRRLQDIVLKCIETKRENRYQSCDELDEALVAAFEKEGIPLVQQPLVRSAFIFAAVLVLSVGTAFIIQRLLVPPLPIDAQFIDVPVRTEAMNAGLGLPGLKGGDEEGDGKRVLPDGQGAGPKPLDSKAPGGSPAEAPLEAAPSDSPRQPPATKPGPDAAKPAPSKSKPAETPALPAPSKPRVVNVRDASAYNNAGNSLMKQKRYPEAEEQFKLALQASGDAQLSLIHGNIANLYRIQKKNTDARRHYEAVLQSEPGHVKATRYLGDIAFDEKRYADAENYYRRALDLSPGHGYTHLQLANTIAGQGRKAEAEPEFKAAIQSGSLGKNTFAAINGLANLYVDIGKPKNAVETYQKAIASEPQNLMGYYNLGILFGSMKKYGDARKQFEKMIQLDPRHVKAHFQLGNMSMMEKKPAQARKFLETSISLNPKFALAHYNLGLVCGELGDRGCETEHMLKACQLGYGPACSP